MANLNFPSDYVDEMEIVSDEKLIDVLKKLGIDSPEAVEMLDRWTEQKQVEASKDKSGVAGFELNVHLAEVCFEAGLFNKAFDAFWDAIEQANNQGWLDKADQVKARLVELKL